MMIVYKLLHCHTTRMASNEAMLLSSCESVHTVSMVISKLCRATVGILFTILEWW